MIRHIQVAPSILSANFAAMGDEVRRMELCGADMIHCDVMDGDFVPNISFGPKMIADIRNVTKLPLDAHLMVSRPERYVDRFIDAGADFVTIHCEATDCLEETLGRIRARGCKCGVVVNPETDCAKAFPVLPQCDMVLLMSVHPGFGGQSFLAPVLDKVREMRAYLDAHKLPALLEIDGGVSTENIAQILTAGADVIVAGSAVFQSKDPASVIAALRGESKR